MNKKEQSFFRLVVKMIVVFNLGSLAWADMARQQTLNNLLLEGEWTRDELDQLWGAIDGQTLCSWYVEVRDVELDNHPRINTLVIVR